MTPPVQHAARNEHVENTPRRIFGTLQIVAAVLVALTGVVVLSGWIWEKPILKGSFFWNITVKSNTAIGFLLAGLSLLFHALGGTRRPIVQLARSLGAIVFLIGFLTMTEHVIGWDVGIDQAIFREAPGAIITTSPNRMGPPASISFALAGVALFLLHGKSDCRKACHDWVSALAVVILMIALLPAIGYLFNAQQLFGLAKYTAIALPTALSFLLLSVGLLSACPNGFVLSFLTSDNAGGMLLRRLLIPAIVIPPLLGYLRTIGEREGYYDTSFGRSLLILAFMIIFTGLVWWSAKVVARTDLARRGAEEARARLGAIVESSEDAIVGATLEGIVTSWNQAAHRMLGYVADEVIGQPMLRIVPPEYHENESRIRERIRAGEHVDHFDTVRRTRDGRRLDVSVTVSPVLDHKGRTVGTSTVARDITQSKRLESERERLLASEKSTRSDAQRVNRLKDEFLVTLSHELRTPLNAILGWASLLSQSPGDAKELQHGLDTIERNARMQTQLIDDLLDMGRIISGKLRLDVERSSPVTFIEAAVETVRPAAEAKGVRLESTLDPSVGPISGDANRLQQVMWNLLSNAIKFTPSSGSVRISLARVDANVEITVADTGQGIEADFLPFVFDRFRQADGSITRKSGGLGLGLAIAKQLVEMHGGQIRVQSAGLNQGATFTLSLPIAAVQTTPALIERRPSTAETSALLAEGRTSDLVGLKILAVDDELDARDLIRRVLDHSGADVISASSGAEALTILESIAPDVLICDIGMPDMDGYELLRRVRAMGTPQGKRIPAIALTAFARSEDRTRALLAGYLVHVSKPVEPTELRATVAAVVGRTGVTSSSAPPPAIT